jgi:hypothetical protein
LSPKLSPACGGASIIRWRSFHRTTVDQETIVPLVVVFARGDTWNIDFGDRDGSVARGGAWQPSRAFQGHVRARGGSNDDDLSGFCRSSDDLSDG